MRAVSPNVTPAVAGAFVYFKQTHKDHKLSRIPGSTRPARVSCHVYTIR